MIVLYHFVFKKSTKILDAFYQIDTCVYLITYKDFSTSFKSFSFFDELFSILLIVISCFILYIWILLYENEIKIGKLSIHYILVSTALILTIIFYILKIIVLRKGKSNTKILFLSISTFIELVIMVLIGIDTFNIL